MKLSRFVVVASFAALLVFGCKNAPKTVSEEEAREAAEAAEAASEMMDVLKDYFSGINMEGAKKYTVVSGDTLSQIAIREYGKENGYYYPLIMLGSSEVVADPENIEPGWELTIPDLQANLNDPLTRGTLKDFLKAVAGVYKERSDSETATKAEISRAQTAAAALEKLSDDLQDLMDYARSEAEEAAAAQQQR